MIKLTFNSVKDRINEGNRSYCFEIYGLDIILDSNYDMYLLEVNDIVIQALSILLH